jgi:FMN-dependent NADH-azoreductase
MKLLHIDSSIQGEASASRGLTREIVARWEAARPGIDVTYRDLAVTELPHLSGAAFRRTDELEAARNAALLDEFLDADVVVIGAPLYNFGIPSQLKAWIDRIVVAGKTFRYSASGPQGLARGKKVILAVSRGGVYAPGALGEFGESYLTFVFGFIGVDVSVVRAEGLALPERRESGLSAARAAIPAPAALAA